jgi:hypothetical protein
MNIGSTVIIKYSPGMPAWQAEFVNRHGEIVGQKALAGVLHWLVRIGRGPVLEYRPHELEEVQQEAAA